MNKQKVSSLIILRLALLLLAALLLAGCGAGGRVGAMQYESKSVDLGDAETVRVDIVFGAGNLTVNGGTQKLVEADFAYNVARLKPEVKYTDGKLSLQQPESRGLPSLRDIEGFQNRWNVRLYDGVPMDLRIDIGGGNSDLQLADLALTSLDVKLGAGSSTIDLNGDWTQDLKVTIDAGAADLNVKLPELVGVRVEVEAGLSAIDAPDLVKNGNVYTNAAYGKSEVTLQVNVEAGLGLIDLEVEEASTASD